MTTFIGYIYLGTGGYSETGDICYLPLGENSSHFPDDVEKENIVCPKYIKLDEEGDFYPVYMLCNSAFKNCSNIKSIVIPDTVIEIGCETFNGCSSLTNIELPSGLQSFNGAAGEAGTFKDCTSLVSINIPSSVTSIPSSTFKNCTSLTSVNLPNNLNSIEDEAFKGCTSLTNINLPTTLTTLGSEAFKGCTSLTTVNLPANLSWVSGEESGTFGGCTSLESVYIEMSIANIEWDAFSGCTSLKNYYLNSAQSTQEFYNGNDNFMSAMINNDIGTGNPTLYIKSDFYNSSATAVVYSGYGAFIYNETKNGYAKYLYDSSYGQNDGDGTDSSDSSS